MLIERGARIDLNRLIKTAENKSFYHFADGRQRCLEILHQCNPQSQTDMTNMA
jgi:hypothetical protein